jgi:hypothetical protein
VGRPGAVGFNASAGWERELAGGGHVSVSGETEDTKDGRYKSKKKTYYAEFTKGACGPTGSTKGTVACGRGEPAQ